MSKKFDFNKAVVKLGKILLNIFKFLNKNPLIAGLIFFFVLGYLSFYAQYEGNPIEIIGSMVDSVVKIVLWIIGLAIFFFVAPIIHENRIETHVKRDRFRRGRRP